MASLLTPSLVPGRLRSHGRTRAQRRRPEVAGPYESQSSVPGIRRHSVRSEHAHPAPHVAALRKTPEAPLLALGLLPSYQPGHALAPIPNLLGMSDHQRQRLEREGQRDSALKAILKAEIDAKHAPSTLEDLGIAAALSPVGPEALIGKLGLAGIERIAPAAARAISASEDAASAGGAASRALDVARGGVIRRGVAKLEPDAVAAARQGVARRAAQQLDRLPAPVRTGAQVGSRIATAPIRHPFTAPVAAQVPLAVIHGNPAELGKALQGKGVYADVAGIASGALSHVSPVLGEALNLPATVLPSTYLTGKAGIEAAGGHTAALKKLLAQYRATGLLPALVEGDPSKALHAFAQHPLYSGLEASGALAALGRGAGAIARETTGGRIGGLARPDLTIQGYPNVAVKRQYSRDLFRQLLQRAHDRRTGNEIKPGTMRGKEAFRRAVVRDAGDRFQANAEAVRRLGRAEVEQAARDFAPKRKAFGLFDRLDHASADVVAHAIERVITHPETFHQDLGHYKAQLDAVYNDGHNTLDQAQVAANRTLARQLDVGIKRASPEHVVEAADAFIAAHQPIVDALVEHGLLDSHQALKAAVIPFARVHMGAEHGIPHAPIERLEALLAETRPRLKEEGRQHLAGYRDSVREAHKRVQYAESGHLQAERTLSTLRAKLRAEGDAPREATIQRLERAVETTKAARRRIGVAKTELHETVDALKRAAVDTRTRRQQAIKQIEGELAKAKAEPEQVIDAHGNPLSLEQITAEMQRRGVQPPGFLSHKAPTRGDWYRAWFPDGARAPRGARTGESVATGSRDAGWESIVRQLARSRGLLDRARTWHAFISRFGIDLRGAGIDTMHDAERVLRDPARYGLNPKVRWTAVRRYPFPAMKGEVQAALEHQDPTIAAEGILSKALATAVDPHDPTAPVVFMPQDLVRNMADHFAPLGTGWRAVQMSSTLLKRAVLPFSPSFYLGNAIDNMIRTALAGVGPQHFILGRRIARELTPEQLTQLISGAHFSSVDQLAVHRDAEDFAGTSLQHVATALAHVRATPGPREALRLIQAGSNLLLHINGRITETLPQYGALGKIAARDVQAMQGHWSAAIRLQPKVIGDIVNGLHDPDTVIRYQKEIEQIYGNWSRMSPFARKFLSSVAPFWTWARAATKLVFLTMPAHRSVLTGILTAASRMTQAEREQFGLDKLGKEPLPGWLQGGLPIRGSISPWGKYTSFGYSGNLLESGASTVLPQLRDVLANLEGRDWKGTELQGGEGSRIVAALKSGIESYIPGYNTVVGLIEKGPGYLSPVHVESPGALPYLRSLSHSKQITVPESGSGGSSSSGGVDYGKVFSGTGGSSVDYGKVFSGR
jgi:hypothetical protein